MNNKKVIAIILLFLTYSCKLKSQDYILKDTIRKAIFSGFEINNYFKDYKLYNLFINQKTVKYESQNTVVSYEMTIHFGKSKYELNIAQVPIIECLSDSYFSYNLTVDKKKQKPDFKKANCTSLDNDVRNRFKRGTIIQKEKIFLNPTKKRKAV